MNALQILTLGDHRRLAYSEYGAVAGKPLLYCHGAPGSAREVADFADAARAAGFRLIAPNRPGYPGSDLATHGGLRDWARDAVSLLDALAIGRCQVLGYSAGGAYALALAHAFPERVSAVALCGSVAPGLLDPEIERRLPPAFAQTCRAARETPEALAGMLAPMADAPAQLLDLFSAEMPAADRQLLAGDALRATYLAVCADALRSGGAGMIRDFASFAGDWGFRLEDIDAPVSIWHGDLDANVAPFLAGRLAAALPRATLHRVADAGHLLLYSRWAEIVRDVVA